MYNEDKDYRDEVIAHQDKEIARLKEEFKAKDQEISRLRSELANKAAVEANYNAIEIERNKLKAELEKEKNHSTIQAQLKNAVHDKFLALQAHADALAELLERAFKDDKWQGTKNALAAYKEWKNKK